TRVASVHLSASKAGSHIPPVEHKTKPERQNQNSTEPFRFSCVAPRGCFGSRIWSTPQHPVFSPLSKTLVVLRVSQHRDFSLRISHLIREKPRFFCAGAPVLGLINEVANHSPPPLPVACRAAYPVPAFRVA